MRVKLTNQIRGLLAEYGIVFPQRIHNLRKSLPALFDPMNESVLSDTMKTLLRSQYAILTTLDEQIDACENTIKQLAQENPVCQRLQTIEGIGPITSFALEAQVGDATVFKNGRHFAAYVGLVPRHSASGNKVSIQGISKRGDNYLRELLVHGARAVLYAAPRKTDPRSVWITGLKERVGHNKATVALANKNARVALAILKSGEAYRPTTVPF